jgi:hypothetical protein
VPVVGSPVVEKEEEEAGYTVSESTVQAIQQVAMRKFIDQMEARIEDLKNHIGLQRGSSSSSWGSRRSNPRGTT